MPKFRKKPVVIEARQFNDDGNSYALLHWVNEGQNEKEREFASWENGAMFIPTLEGTHRADKGDWIIKGVQGEFYPCKPEIFTATYESAE